MIKDDKFVKFLDTIIKLTTKVEMENYAEAIKDYDEVIALDSNYIDAYYNRGIAKKAIGDTKGGEADLQKAEHLLKRQ